MKNNSTRQEYFHAGFLQDLAELSRTMTEEQFNAFEHQLATAINNARSNPSQQGTALKYELSGWNHLKFHPFLRPPKGVNPPYRYIYRNDAENLEHFHLVVGKRNAKGVEGDSIYKTAKHRILNEGDNWISR